MEVEHEVTFGREKKRADICIFDKDKLKPLSCALSVLKVGKPPNP